MLSKSKFLKGLQCPKLLYLYSYHRDLQDPVSPSQQARFFRGTEAGILARDLFPGGKAIIGEGDIPNQNFVDKTRDLMESGTQIIYEACFIEEDILVAVDILVKGQNGWNIYEVKSATEVKDDYVPDAAIQYYVLKKARLEIEDVFLVHINNKYERNGGIDVYQLFVSKSVFEQVKNYQAGIPGRLSSLKKILQADNPPPTDIGIYCEKPHECGFMGTCWQSVPEVSVFNISNLNKKKKYEMYHSGIRSLNDIPSTYNLGPNQRLQVDAWSNQKEMIDKDKIRESLSALVYPLYFVDFEGLYDQVIPLFDKSGPYEQIPFQYSLHILRKPGGLTEHKEFLADPASDPRIPFTENLIRDLEHSGSIVVYNKNYESPRLKEIAAHYPMYARQIKKIRARIFDLMDIFMKKYYYSPKLLGSYTIKDVLPVLVPELSYKELNIRDGGTASNTFADMVNDRPMEKSYDVLRKDLLEYCRLDTWAMVKIFEVIEKMI